MAYNKNSATGGDPKVVHSPTLNGLVNSGADLLTNMYDIRIFFPSSIVDGPNKAYKEGNPGSGPDVGKFAFNYPVTVRASGFNVPEVSTGTYEIKYHGNTVKRPNGNMEFNREFEIEFREDAAFELRNKFQAWLGATVDPVTGAVSNGINCFGTVEVGTVMNEYWAPTMTNPTGDPDKSGDKQIQAADGSLTSRHDGNPIATWSFYHVWVSKVTQPQFSTEGSEASKFTVTFQFMDCDMPFFGGNAGEAATASSDWTSRSSKK